MTREEIEKFSEVETYCFGTNRDEIYYCYKLGCIDGLKVADAEPNIKSLWHDVSEMPKEGEWYLAQIGDDAFDTFIMAMEKEQDWRC